MSDVLSMQYKCLLSAKSGHSVEESLKESILSGKVGFERLRLGGVKALVI